MGQVFSAQDKDHGDSETNFTAYFKKIKKENKIIPEETIHLIESHPKKGNILGANSVIRDALKNIDNAPINIAVTGECGAGKSSFINALRGIGPEDEGAAETGVTATTMKRTPYKHPQIKTLTLWDLPGIGTMKFTSKDYLEEVQFEKYDFFILVSATRLTSLDLELVKAIRFMKKNCYFVRTKVDGDIQNGKKSKPCTFDREKYLEMMRNNYVDWFRENNMNAPQSFLISTYNISDYDFPVLIDTLIKDLPVQKRHNFMLSMTNITEAAIDRHRESMQQDIWKEALKDGLLATIPAVGIFRDDVEKLKVTLNRYHAHFGVEDESLEVMAVDLQVPVEQLKKIIRSPYLLDIKKEETLGDRLLEYIEKYMGATGGPHATVLYFMKTFYLHHAFLDTVTEDAKVLLRLTY